LTSSVSLYCLSGWKTLHTARDYEGHENLQMLLILILKLLDCPS
jgi:hypothetical protein